MKPMVLAIAMVVCAGAATIVMPASGERWVKTSYSGDEKSFPSRTRVLLHVF